MFFVHLDDIINGHALGPLLHLEHPAIFDDHFSRGYTRFLFSAHSIDFHHHIYALQHLQMHPDGSTTAQPDYRRWRDGVYLAHDDVCPIEVRVGACVDVLHVSTLGKSCACGKGHVTRPVVMTNWPELRSLPVERCRRYIQLRTKSGEGTPLLPVPALATIRMPGRSCISAKP